MAKSKVATLCFVRHGDKILMINRLKPPFMGLWNAVGGHLETGESVSECAIREIEEESGIKVNSVQIFSKFTWNYDDETGYACLVDLPRDFDESQFPLNTKEGIVAFLPIQWVIDKNNSGVIEDLRIFIKDIREKSYKNYHLIYDKNKLVEAIVKE